MSGGSPPPDNSLAVEQSRQAAAEKERLRQAEEARLHKEELAGLRGTARTGAGGQVRNYFSSQGVDPEQYAGSIDQQLNDILNGISPTEENPGAAFTGAGQSIWDTLQTAGRTKASRDINQVFAPDFQYSRVADTLDDPYLAGVEGEQYANADQIIKNMLDRGVLTSGGYSSAQKDLENQRAGVRSRLNEIGMGLLNKQRGELGDIANRGRQAAGSLNLGDTFDPYKYGTEADTSLSGFLAGLGDQIRSQVPGQLFNTAGLAAIGGAGQGLGNTAFNPAAAGGTIEDPSDTTADDEDTNANSIF
jgi:hypothetical protein